MKRFLLIALLCWPAAGFGQRVYIEHSGNDLVGQQFAFSFKEAIRRSAAFSVADSSSGTVVNVQMISLDSALGAGPSGQASAISILATVEAPTKECPLAEFGVYHNVYIVGAERTAQMADSLLADLDKNLGQIRAALKKLTPENDPETAPRDAAVKHKN